MNTVAADTAGKIDARPVRLLSDKTPWNNALQLRDRFEAAVHDTLAREGLEAAVFVSGNGNYPPWVRLEAWLPSTEGGKILDGNGRERVDLLFAINVKPFHEYETVVSATLTRGKKTIAVADRPDFPVRYVEQWTLYALGRGGKPRNYTPVEDALLGMITSILPIPSRYHNPVQRAYRTRFTSVFALTLVSLAAIVFGGMDIADHRGYGVPTGIFFVLGGIVGIIAAVVIVRFRKRTVSVTPQPAMPPRDLVMVDSWHAVIAELGREFETAKRKLVESLSGDTGFGITVRPETYTHRAPNGYEQREQLVVSKDQGTVHVHIYQFGQDIFVGWNAYLNWSQWGETTPVSVKIREGKEIEFRQVQPSIYIPNQFDLIDLSSLSEFVHRRLERELKAQLKEKAIDQEIDFKIIRGDRDRALDEERHGDGKKKGKGWGYRADT